jgi:hypothetical protein
MPFDKIASTHKSIKTSSSMLAKVGNKVILNEVDNDSLSLSSWISLGTFRTKTSLLFYRAKIIAIPYNILNNIILKYVIIALKQ